MTPWTVACQPPLSMAFSRQECWSGLSFPSPEDLPDPGIKPVSLMSPALAGRFLTTSATWEAKFCKLTKWFTLGEYSFIKQSCSMEEKSLTWPYLAFYEWDVELWSIQVKLSGSSQHTAQQVNCSDEHGPWLQFSRAGSEAPWAQNDMLNCLKLHNTHMWFFL